MIIDTNNVELARKQIRAAKSPIFVMAKDDDFNRAVLEYGRFDIILGIEAGIAGAILYTTFVPCLECTKMAITIGIRKFVCLDSYPETDFELLKEAGVEVVQLDKSRIAKWAKELVSTYEKSI